MLRRVMLAVSASDRIQEIVTTAPVARDVVTRFVAGATQDDALRVTEKYRMTSHDTIHYEATIEDGKVFTKPWTTIIGPGEDRGAPG